MNLIELLFAYKENVFARGRARADTWLIACLTEERLYKYIRESVSDTGDFLDAFGKTFNVLEQ